MEKTGGRKSRDTLPLTEPIATKYAGYLDQVINHDQHLSTNGIRHKGGDHLNNL